jgi:very-short-patch-repair endonuclease
MGEGWVGVTALARRIADEKYPMGGAHERARALRREMTEAETKLWRMLRSRQIEGHRFRRQVPLGRYIADFICHEARLIVELDGGQHDSLSQQEANGSQFLQSEGYRRIRLWNDEVLENPEGVHAMIVRERAAASPPPNPPPSRGGV